MSAAPAFEAKRGRTSSRSSRRSPQLISQRIVHELPDVVEKNNMPNHKMKTVVATSLYAMYTYDGYTPVGAVGKTTMWQVMDYLKRTPRPTFDENFWPLAEEVIEYFQQLPMLPEYKTIMARKDSSRFKSCIDIAKDDEVTDISFPFAVEMGRLYGELCPATPQALNPLKTEAKIAAPDEYMGVLNQADRFFVKLER